MENVRTSGTTNPKLLLRMLMGAVLGAAVGYAAVTVAVKLHVSPKSFGLSDGIALWLGTVLIACAIVVFFVSSNRRRLAKTLEGDDATLPATTAEVHTFRLQAATLGLAGVMVLIPSFAAGSIAAHPGGHPVVALAAFAGVAILFILQTAANIHLWRTGDEFVRGLMLTICALTFAIGQGLLFLYAAAERLHLVREISSWDVVTLLLTLYLFVGGIISLRHQR